jgi:hypothetical protein
MNANDSDMTAFCVWLANTASPSCGFDPNVLCTAAKVTLDFIPDNAITIFATRLKFFFYRFRKTLIVRLEEQVAVCKVSVFLPNIAVAAQRLGGKAYAWSVMLPNMAVRSGCVCKREL